MLKRFLARQVYQIREGGWSVFWLKLRILGRKTTEVILLPVFLPVIAVIRLISPWLIFRIGIMVDSIGHFAANTELYLCELDAGINTPKKPYIDLWCLGGSNYNQQLNRMWKRKLIITSPNFLVPLLYREMNLFPGCEPHLLGTNWAGPRDVNNLLGCSTPHLSFLPEEEQQGKAGLKALGIPDGAPFVCLCVRDSAYRDKVFPGERNRHTDYRNSMIANHVSASQSLAKLGYHIIRMGAVVKDPMPISHRMIIDYATNGMRSDFMDIYLSAKCSFFISTGTGIDQVAAIFRRPYMYVNLVPIEDAHTWSRCHIFIPKKHFLVRARRFMTFREIFESGAGQFGFTFQYEENGIELIENTPEEIVDVTLEMENRLNGTWQTSEEDEELQKRFWDVFPTKAICLYRKTPLHGAVRARIGTKFLRQNKELLE